VSPVIEVVLLLAVTVMLGLVVGPGVIGNIGSLANETPNGESAFFFEEREEGGDRRLRNVAVSG
jgi:FlaG/FlaF family flagellin (archaellin)